MAITDSPQLLVIVLTFLYVVFIFRRLFDRLIVHYLPLGIGCVSGIVICDIFGGMKGLPYITFDRERAIWEVAADVVVSYCVACVAILNLDIVPFKQLMFLHPGVVILFCLLETLFFQLHKPSDLPLKKIWRLYERRCIRWPVRLSILDCGGQEIYHAAHHIYMTAHSTYLIVFRLIDLDQHFASALSRIRFWLASVAAHAQHPEARVVLVATHAASVPPARRDEALKRLEAAVTRRYCARLASDVIAIDNAERSESEEGIRRLRQVIWDTATKAEFVRQPSRVSWFHFADYINNIKWRHRKATTDSLVTTRSALWKDLQIPCRLSNRGEFGRMLRLFHDRGDIFTDLCSQDLNGSVLLDPTILERAARCLIPRNNKPRRVFFSHERLNSHLRHLEVDTDSLLAMLETLGFVLPLGDSSQYLVPQNLSKRPAGTEPLIQDPSFVFRFDFEDFDPQAIFFRLLSKMLDAGLNQSDLRRNAALFRSQNGSRFSLEIDDDFRLWLRSSDNDEESALGTAYFVLGLLQRVCRRHFQFAAFQMQAPCECSKAAQATDCSDADFVTVVDFQEWPCSRLTRRFPSRRLSYICNHDPTLLSSLDGGRLSADRRAQVDAKVSAASGLQMPEAVPTDVFVSCAQQDRHFLFEELLLVLEAPWTLSDVVDDKDPEVKKLLETSLTVSANFCDDASPGMVELWSSAQRRDADLRQASVVLAIVSLFSATDVECREERCKALMLNKPVIPVFLNGCRSPLDLIGVKGLHRPSCEGRELAREFYVPLLRSLQSAAGRREPSGA